MKRLILSTLLLIVLVLPVTAMLQTKVSAVDVFGGVCGSGQSGTGTDVCKDVNAAGKQPANPVVKAIRLAINIVSLIIGIAAVIMIIVFGLQIVTSNGDAQAVAKARSGIIYALVGIAIAVFAQIMVTFVISKT